MREALQRFFAVWKKPQWRGAMILGAISDAISFGLAFSGPFEVAADLITAVALFAILGFRWPLFIPLVVEAIPGVAVFPTWVVAIAAMAAADVAASPPAAGGAPGAKP
jgi:hypothetical protein